MSGTTIGSSAVGTGADVLLVALVLVALIFALRAIWRLTH